MSDQEWKQKGNAAFSKGDWDGAISAYTKAIKHSPKNDTYYSNRSAAYLKKEDFDNALKDANMCIKLQPKNHKGYGRKGATYHAMKKYDRAINAYKEGLKACPDEEHLLKGLAAAKKAGYDNSKATKALRKSKVAKEASKSRSSKVKKADGVSDFVKQTRQELKLQLAAIQSQLDLINELASMEEQEKLDLLFTLIDQDGDGKVDAKELAAAMRKRNEELTFKDSIENAVDMVATFDTDGDAQLDPDEFRNYINVMLKELGVSFTEFSEFLVIQILFSDNKEADTTDEEVTANLEEEVKAREVLFDMLSDERMVELFRLFDHDGCGELNFRDVAVCLYQHAGHGGNKQTRTAFNLLLMMDKNDKRKLNYEQFGRLMMSCVTASNTSFTEVSEDITIAIATNARVDERAIATLFVPESVYQTAKEMNREFKKQGKTGDIMDPLAFARLKKLFQLWDVDGSGDMDLTELTEGLGRFQAASGIGRDANTEATMLFQFDSDGNNTLDTKEFACAMSFYAKANKVALNDLIDFMCVTTVVGDENSKSFQSAYGRALGKDVIPKLKMANETYFEEAFD